MKALFSSVLVSFIVPSALFVQAVPTPRGSGDSVITRNTASTGHIYGKRASAGDVLVFKFADVLEQLEDKFYQAALSKFTAKDFEDAGFTTGDLPIQQLQVIQQDEATHSWVLESTLESAGATPLTCNFNFDAALASVDTMLATARAAENAGASAYSGAVNLITDPSLLITAATILSVEGRHSTVQNILSGSGTAIPSPFDIALNTSEVLAIVTPFIVGPCDTGVTPNPTLTITNQGDIKPGTLLTFESTAFDSSSDGNLYCQLLNGNSTATTPLPLDQCIIPNDISGPTYTWVTHGGDPLPNDVIVRSTNQQVAAGPALFFVDVDPQALGMAAVEGLYTSTSELHIPDTSPSKSGEPYGCWFHGQPCHGSSQ